MGMIFYKYKSVFIIVYILITIIKLFTARIDLQIEEGPTIIFRCFPFINNIFYGNNKKIEYYSEKYAWYKSRQYKSLLNLHSSKVLLFVNAYDCIIYIWWISTVIILIITIIRLIRLC